MYDATHNMRRNGFALLFAVLTASLVLAIGLTIFNITLKEFILSSQIRDSQFAFYAADTGLECALYWDLEHSSYAGSVFGYYGNTLSDGLVGYWKFDEGNGSSAADTSGYGNTGTLMNFGAGDWVDGQIGTALAFNNSTTYVTVDDDSSLNPSVITVAAWIRTSDTTAAADQIVTKDDGTGRVWQFRKATNNTIQLVVFNDTAFGAWNGTTNIADGMWHHVAGTWDGSTIRVYVDGDEEGVGTAFSGTLRSGQASDVNIGRLGNGSGYFNGRIDEVRVYDRVLSSGEIDDVYAATPGSDFTGPVGEESNVNCVSTDISGAVNDWITVVDEANGLATTTFTLPFGGPSNRCARVMVAKADGGTRIESRGYNSCDTNNPRRIERALRATY